MTAHSSQEVTNSGESNHKRPPEKLTLPVYIVEEHHEVIPYWFHAAESGRLPSPKGNTLVKQLSPDLVVRNFVFVRFFFFFFWLVHVDAHSDMAIPVVSPDFPLFRWPKKSEIPMLMTENDRFIVAASLSGMFSRIVWIWPSWDEEENLKTMYSDHMIVDVTTGTWLRPIAHGSEPIIDLCFCVTALNSPPSKGLAGDGRYNYCYRFNSSEPRDMLGTNITQAGCLQKMRVRVEVVSETALMRSLKAGQFEQIEESSGYILDIDEDYFGCEASVLPLYKAGIDEAYIQRISFWVEKLFCGKTIETESAADGIFQMLITFIINSNNKCHFNSTSRDIFLHPCGVKLYNILDERIFNVRNRRPKTGLSVEEVFCTIKATSSLKKQHISILSQLLSLLHNLTEPQLHALSEVGVCWYVSPSTFNNDKVHHFKLCDGNNKPNNTMVTFFTPDQWEVRQRSQRLETILQRMTLTPDLVTLCRSVRDGYTPRSRFRQIESSVIGVMRGVYGGEDGGNVNVLYDRDLLGGVYGWPGRSYVNPLD
ncbi:uncharacterized protein LOC118478692 [Aplysia californica]|uniref:Uncharacterized protein LOC118478692 n=1 Tax=Aplysia californica TaxID=6500 RepID=A0ABM1W1Y4_APLCA|nr:uncharacterized protein LOC118478692 [Aplysia californica]